MAAHRRRKGHRRRADRPEARPQYNAGAGLRLDDRRQTCREQSRRQERRGEASLLEGKQVCELVARFDSRLGFDRVAPGGLDKDNAEDGELCGPSAECGAQNVIHRLNALSKLVQTWARAHRIALENPVKPGVRPGKPDGRDRRLVDDEEKRLLEAAQKSSRPWLKAAIIISIETCMRQGELAGLIRDRVKLTGDYPHVDLLKTKNDRPRRVPLSKRAITAFKTLRPEGHDCGDWAEAGASGGNRPRKSSTPSEMRSTIRYIRICVGTIFVTKRYRACSSSPT